MAKNELMKTPPASDGIDGHTDEQEGKEAKKSGLFRGGRIKFLKTEEWEIDGEAVAPEFRLVLSRITRICTRWAYDISGKKMPAETIVLEDGERFPDLDAWNEKLPRTEWVKGFNGLEGPWKKQQIVYFCDLQAMQPFHWADGTMGGGIAIRDAVNSIRAMRRFRPGAAPVVELSTKFMNTSFGGRQRPHFVIHSWITTSGGEGGEGGEPQPTALPAPTAAQPPSAQEKPGVAPRRPKKTAVTLDGILAAKPVSLAEEMNDEIPIL